MSTITDTLARVTELYDQGRFLDAYDEGRPLGPLAEWTGVPARVLGGRLARRLGAPKLGRVLNTLAYREDRGDDEARFFYVASALERHGPLLNWQLVRRLGDPQASDGKGLSDWYIHKAHILAMLRDFESAELLLEKASDFNPDRPWLWVIRGHIYELQDRHEDALDAAEQALAIHPWYTTAVQAAAHTLLQLNRDDEAIQLLSEGAEHVQSGDLLMQLGALYSELGEHAVARETFDRGEQLYPLIEKDHRKWLAARRSDAAYHLGDYDECIAQARNADPEFHKLVAERLDSASPDAQRVELPVGFVRQHHVTCTPATLAAISGYWKMPAEHLEIAETICYDGTPEHSKRRWAEENGFVTREFLVTWDTARALIDRGVPFALTTTYTGMGHSQTVFGYDSRRGTLLVRDPTERHYREYLADKLLEDQAASGPRGMVMLPECEAARLDGLELRETELYDHSYRLQQTLEKHDREEAEQHLAAMRQVDAQHRLTLGARATLANYDADPVAALQSTEALLALFPTDSNLLLAKISCLSELGRREDRLALLTELARKENPDPVFWQALASELGEDAREHAEAIYWLRRVLRCRPQDGHGLSVLANIRWDQQRREEALGLYRLAACLEDKNEGCAKAYFIAARYLGETESAVKLLEDRFRRFARHSGWPARTLAWAYEQQERLDQAEATLIEARALRPADGELMLHAADFCLRTGKHARAAELLADAKPLAHAGAGLRNAAGQAMFRGDLDEAIDLWRQILQREPLAQDAHGMLAELLADAGGEEAAIAHLRAAAEEFPHNHALRVMLVERIRSEGPAAVEAETRALLELHPTDPWARRELAYALLSQGKTDEAEQQTEIAYELEPSSPVVHVLRGYLHRAKGEAEPAREDFRAAIRISVDHEHALSALMDACDTKQQRQAELAFIHGELVRQPIFGDGLLLYRDYAASSLDADKVLRALRTARTARPDLWRASAAMARQLVAMEQFDEALDIARQASERFPLLPRIWLELALVHRARDEHEQEAEALQQALRINPGWSLAARELADAYRESGRIDDALEVLEQAVRREPRDAVNIGYLADLQWTTDQQDDALAQIEKAVRLYPAYQWAWDRLQTWCSELERTNRALELTRELTERRNGESRWWIQLAEMLTEPDQFDERLAAIDRAIQIDPSEVRAHDLKADLLAQAERFDDARAACQPPVFGDQPPLLLQARAADVEARRGDSAEAIAQMRRVVVQDPDYFWAWTRLAQWYDAQNDVGLYLEAAEQLIRLAPEESVCWGYLGDARSRSEDPQGAKEAFVRAVAIAPEYLFGQRALFDLHLADDELEAAADSLAAMEQHGGSAAEVHAAGVRLAAKQNDHGGALVRLAELVRADDAEVELISSAINALADAGQFDRACEAVAAAIDAGQAHESAGDAWVDAMTRADRWRECADRVDGWTDRDMTWVRAAWQLVHSAAESGQKRILNRFVRRNRTLLAGHMQTWGEVGKAFHTTEQYSETIKWLADWRTRDEVEPWMLFFLAVSLYDSGRRTEMVEVSRAALELPSDYTTMYHQLWMALDEVLRGDYAAASARMAEVDRSTLEGFYDAIGRIVATMLELVDRDPPLPYRHACSWLRAGLPQEPWIDRDRQMRKLLGECRARLAADRGHRWRAWWAKVFA